MSSISGLREVIARLRTKAVTWNSVRWPGPGSGQCSCKGLTTDGFWVEAEVFRQKYVGGGEFRFSVTDSGPGSVTVFRDGGLARSYRTQEGTTYVDRMQYTPDTLTEESFEEALGEVEAYIALAKKEKDASDKAVADAANDAAQRRFFD
jgi:hypothetical protein